MLTPRISLLSEIIVILTAWIQVDEGQETILAYIKTPSETKPSGSVIAKTGCWSMLKGGFTAYEDEKVDLIFKV